MSEVLVPIYSWEGDRLLGDLPIPNSAISHALTYGYVEFMVTRSPLFRRFEEMENTPYHIACTKVRLRWNAGDRKFQFATADDQANYGRGQFGEPANG